MKHHDPMVREVAERHGGVMSSESFAPEKSKMARRALEAFATAELPERPAARGPGRDDRPPWWERLFRRRIAAGATPRTPAVLDPTTSAEMLRRIEYADLDVAIHPNTPRDVLERIVRGWRAPGGADISERAAQLRLRSG
jgi:hypothetical protein